MEDGRQMAARMGECYSIVMGNKTSQRLENVWVEISLDLLPGHDSVDVAHTVPLGPTTLMTEKTQQKPTVQVVYQLPNPPKVVLCPQTRLIRLEHQNSSHRHQWLSPLEPVFAMWLWEIWVTQFLSPSNNVCTSYWYKRIQLIICSQRCYAIANQSTSMTIWTTVRNISQMTQMFDSTNLRLTRGYSNT